MKWWWRSNLFPLSLIYALSWKSDHKRGTRGHVGEWESIHFHLWRKSSAFTCCCHLVMEETHNTLSSDRNVDLKKKKTTFLLPDYLRFPAHTSGPEWDRVAAPGHHAPGVKHPRPPRHVHGHGDAGGDSGTLSIHGSYLLLIKSILFRQKQHTSSLLKCSIGFLLYMFPTSVLLIPPGRNGGQYWEKRVQRSRIHKQCKGRDQKGSEVAEEVTKGMNFTAAL